MRLFVPQSDAYKHVLGNGVKNLFHIMLNREKNLFHVHSEHSRFLPLGSVYRFFPFVPRFRVTDSAT